MKNPFSKKHVRSAEDEELIEGLSNQLALSQTHIEVAAEALDHKDAEMFALIEKLHQTMGGKRTPKNESEALERLREMRAHADLYLSIREVLAGRFTADKALLRRLACSLGTAQMDVDTVMARAGQMTNVMAVNRQLSAKVERLEREIEDE